MPPLMATLLLSVIAGPVGKLPPPVATEMQEAILAANKALGLESWTLRGVKPCVDRGGDGSSTRFVTAAETRTCASTVLDPARFKGLGHDYALAILMASVGPETVLAYGLGEHAGWGAYSCDPDRTCRPLRLDPTTKWGKRLVDRQARACAQTDTVWFPADVRACPNGAAAPAAAPPTQANPAPAPAQPPQATPAPGRP